LERRIKSVRGNRKKNNSRHTKLETQSVLGWKVVIDWEESDEETA
jgi:hypothetical protein